MGSRACLACAACHASTRLSGIHTCIPFAAVIRSLASRSAISCRLLSRGPCRAHRLRRQPLRGLLCRCKAHAVLPVLISRLKALNVAVRLRAPCGALRLVPLQHDGLRLLGVSGLSGRLLHALNGCLPFVFRAVGLVVRLLLRAVCKEVRALSGRLRLLVRQHKLRLALVRVDGVKLPLRLLTGDISGVLLLVDLLSGLPLLLSPGLGSLLPLINVLRVGLVVASLRFLCALRGAGRRLHVRLCAVPAHRVQDGADVRRIRRAPVVQLFLHRLRRRLRVLPAQGLRLLYQRLGYRPHRLVAARLPDLVRRVDHVAECGEKHAAKERVPDGCRVCKLRVLPVVNRPLRYRVQNLCYNLLQTLRGKVKGLAVQNLQHRLVACKLPGQLVHKPGVLVVNRVSSEQLLGKRLKAACRYAVGQRLCVRRAVVLRLQRGVSSCPYAHQRKRGYARAPGCGP